MKIERLFQKALSEIENITLCDTHPQLVFEKMNGKRERFTATVDFENNRIWLEGSIDNYVEANELVDFLKYLSRGKNEAVEKQDRKPGMCLCGVDDWELVSRADRCDAPLAGEMFFVLRCNNCGRFERLSYGVR